MQNIHSLCSVFCIFIHCAICTNTLPVGFTIYTKCTNAKIAALVTKDTEVIFSKLADTPGYSFPIPEI